MSIIIGREKPIVIFYKGSFQICGLQNFVVIVELKVNQISAKKRAESREQSFSF